MIRHVYVEIESASGGFAWRVTLRPTDQPCRAWIVSQGTARSFEDAFTQARVFVE